MSEPNNPLDAWRGDFGNSYIERNLVTSDSASDALTAFGRMLTPTGGPGALGSVLEVGANVGINQTALRQLLPDARLQAVEPNPSASATLAGRDELTLTGVVRADAALLPFADDSFDLAFTSGVLIHVPPHRLPLAMREIVRVSRRYVLCSEYFSHEPQEVTYHGKQAMLWKRDFGSAYLAEAPGLKVVDYGFLWQTEIPTFDDFNWWLFEKT